MNNVSYIITEQALTVFADKVYTVHRNDARFEEAQAFIASENWDGLIELIRPANKIGQYLSGDNSITISEDGVRYKGELLEGYVVFKAISMYKDGINPTPLLNFIRNISDNPSYRARRELYGFLEYGSLPITPDGHFLAFKKVNDSYKDVHTNTIDNSIGEVVTMPRSEVDDDSNVTCSTGLHFASREYVRSFHGSHLMVLKINPADVVSIPTDYNNTKGRCCRYEVIDEIEMDEMEKIMSVPVYEDEDEENPDYYYDDDEDEENAVW